MKINRRAGLTERIERLTEVPMLILALLYVIAFFIGYMPRLSADWRAGAELAENVIVAVFAAELVVRVALAERRISYVRSHWLDVLIVVLPFLRPIRFLRILRILPFLARGATGIRRIMGPYHGTWALLIGLASVLISAVLVFLFEQDSGGTIRDFDDALWWAATTVTTVGYGDKFPVTPEGRAVAVFLMIIGIALFGTLTAAIAAYFVEGSREPDRDLTLQDLMDKLDALEQRLNEMREERERRI